MIRLRPGSDRAGSATVDHHFAAAAVDCGDDAIGAEAVGKAACELHVHVGPAKQGRSDDHLGGQDENDIQWFYSNFNIKLLGDGILLSKQAITEIATTAFDKTNQLVTAEEKDENAEETEYNNATTGVNSSSTATASTPLTSSSEVHYDPTFVLPLIYNLFSVHNIDCRKIVEMKLLSYILCCMSSQSLLIRTNAYKCLAKYFIQLETMNKANEEANEEKVKAAEKEKKKNNKKIKTSKDDKDKKVDTAITTDAVDSSVAYIEDTERTRTLQLYSFPEQSQITVLLTALKNAITIKYQYIPSIITQFISRILTILLKADHSLYKPVMRFIVARPTLDFTVSNLYLYRYYLYKHIYLQNIYIQNDDLQKKKTND